MATKPSPRMTVEECWAFVAEAHTGIMTTLRRDGMPIALPLWFACLDRTIYLQTRGRKLQRIRRDPRASFLVEAGQHWAELKAVHLTGTAEVVDLDDELSARFRTEMDRKYAAFSSRASMPRDTAEYYAKAVTGVVRFVADDRVLNWDNAKLTAAGSPRGPAGRC
jgi:nitroimidazol reductase NimA-like FMN-containing flavoprotein (pyridoxamine 5'-phosphate oxidase superfamily)